MADLLMELGKSFTVFAFGLLALAVSCTATVAVGVFLWTFIQGLRCPENLIAAKHGSPQASAISAAEAKKSTRSANGVDGSSLNNESSNATR